MKTGFLTHGLGVVALLISVAAAAGHAPGSGDVDIDIVDDYGRVFPLFPVSTASYDDVWRGYLEARPNGHYGIRVRNLTAGRIGVVVAVDGRNIISGKKSNLAPREKMYVLGPYQSATYTGWRTGGDRINRFYFTESEDSYAGAFGDFSAMGVIAVASFRERNVYREYEYADPQVQDDYGRGSKGKESNGNRSARNAPSEKHGRSDEPGTGYGESRYSPSVRVNFEADRQASGTWYIKYEWRERLCEFGVLECGGRHNRFWSFDEYGFAPPPPAHGYRPAYRR